ncbi:hypothetical protein [Leifsonia sp. NPDC058248]|uniref:hypothetical protein n=1 Tax=Leifsonia sp. NPDC058248 TaxID=3346402 RepID=UPI0036DBC381
MTEAQRILEMLDIRMKGVKTNEEHGTALHDTLVETIALLHRLELAISVNPEIKKTFDALG